MTKRKTLVHIARLLNDMDNDMCCGLPWDNDNPPQYFFRLDSLELRPDEVMCSKCLEMHALKVLAEDF